MKWIKNYLKILELKRRLRRLDKVYCKVLSNQNCCNEKLTDLKLNAIHEEMVDTQIAINELRFRSRNKIK